MSPQQRDTRRKRVETETFVIARTEQGYRVHSPKYPSFIYRVTGIPDSPECSCPDYEYHDKDPDWRGKDARPGRYMTEAPAAGTRAPAADQGDERDAGPHDSQAAPRGHRRGRRGRRGAHRS